MDETKAVGEASNLASLLEKLPDMIKAEDFTEQGIQSLNDSVSACQSSQAVLAACKKSSQDGSESAATALDSAISAIAKLIDAPDFAGADPDKDFSFLLQDLWLQQPTDLTDLNLSCRDDKAAMSKIRRYAFRG